MSQVKFCSSSSRKVGTHLPSILTLLVASILCLVKTNTLGEEGGARTSDLQAYERAASEGDGRAMVELGSIYAKGLKVNQNWTNAAFWYQRAVEAGNTKALHPLGLCYVNGMGVRKEPKKAVGLFNQGAEAGNADCMRQLGYCFIYGTATNKSWNMAFEWFRRAAEAGDLKSFSIVGDCFAKGRGAQWNITNAIKWYERGAELGDSTSMLQLGNLYMDKQGKMLNMAKGADYFQRASEAGNSQAMRKLAGCYLNGTGVEADTEQAVQWLEKGAISGNYACYSDLGYLHLSGSKGLKADPDKAFESYSKGAEAADASSMYGLALCYFQGKGTKEDERKGLTWLTQSANKDFQPAKISLVALRNKQAREMRMKAMMALASALLSSRDSDSYERSQAEWDHANEMRQLDLQRQAALNY